MRRLELDRAEDRSWLQAVRAEASSSPEVEGAAKAIVDDVEARGEAAVLEHTERLDGARLETVRLAPERWNRWADAVDPELTSILHDAAGSIREFHEPQRLVPYQVGSSRQLIRPLEIAGVYVPGGRARYPSSVLMNAVPASVAGVPRICMATPPDPEGRIDPAVALAARIAGVTDLFLMGGAQAVGAFAHGAGAVPRVDKITGPGNAWVAAAKRYVSGRVGVDLDAGPSEVLVIADRSADPIQVAWDLIAQAEHDPLAVALCATPSAELAGAILRRVDELLREEPNPVALEALSARGAVIQTADLDAAVDFSNRFGPEHLHLLVADAESLLPRLHNAGAIFLGPGAPVAAGDYLAGPNHTLPTGGASRFQSGLGVSDFQRRVNVVGWDPAELTRRGPSVARLARAEGLVGHARSVEVRLESSSSPAGTSNVVPPPSPVLRFIRPEVRRQRAYTLAAPIDAPVKLNQNEAPEDLPSELKERIQARFSKLSWQRYPAFDPTPWRDELARHAGWKADGVLIGNGSNELLTLLFRSVVRPGDRVVLPVPCFSLYPLHLDVAGAELIRVPLDPQFRFDVDRLVEASQGARLIILGSPNNPTGTALPAEAVPALLETGALLAVDEAYAEFSGQDFAPMLDDSKALVLFRTFSKAWAGASLRCGYLLGPAPFCAELGKVALPYNVSALTLAAISCLLDEPHRLKARVDCVLGEMSRVRASVEKLGMTTVPSAANFFLFATAPHAPTDLFEKLLAQGVLVRDVSSSVPGHLRVSMGTRAENDRFLKTLSRVFLSP